MAIYRAIYTSFWSDTKVSDNFTPEDKYFMLYCLTNDHTNLSGCYEVSIKQIANELGYDIDITKNLLRRFINIHKIIDYNFENNELYIKNWSKYNWTISPKLDIPLLREIKKIKTEKFKKELAIKYNKRNTVSIPYRYSIDTVADSDSINNIFNINNINNINYIYIYIEKNFKKKLFEEDKLKIIEWVKEYSEPFVKLAFEISVDKGKTNFGYVEAILKDWKEKGYKSIEDINFFSKHKQTILPKWFNKKIKEEDLSKEEIEEMKEILKEFY